MNGSEMAEGRKPDGTRPYRDAVGPRPPEGGSRGGSS
jgi:hypothetical protein